MPMLGSLFCGGKAELMKLGKAYRVLCETDGCINYAEKVRYMQREQAIAAWNKRAQTREMKTVDGALENLLALVEGMCENDLITWNVYSELFDKITGAMNYRLG